MAGRMITFNGKTMNVKTWAEVAGITYVSLRSRLSLGWSIERALTTPTRQRGGKKRGRRKRGDFVKDKRFTILEATEQRDGDSIVYVCRCRNCGSEVMVPSRQLKDIANSPGNPLYGTWFQMIERCENPHHITYKYYGEKGIRVCERWKKSFTNFVIDVGPKPSSRHSIDRIDGEGDYVPENCRWATQKQQMRNRSDNIMIEYHGKTQCLADWAIELSILYGTLNSRYHAGWSVEKMMSKVRSRKKVINTI